MLVLQCGGIVILRDCSCPLKSVYLFRKLPKLQTGLIILTSGICLVLFASTMVTLTAGTMPIFMLAEPVILLVAVVGFVVCVIKSRKKIG